MFNRLKQIGQAISPAAVRSGLAASRQALANGGRLTEEQLAAFTPEERARYEEAMEHARRTLAANADAVIEAELARRVLRGPAGDWLYGPLPDRERMTDLDVGSQLRQARADLAGAARDPLGRKPAAEPPAPVSGDPGEQAAHERAQRDEARTPYLAADRHPLTVTRIATKPGAGVEQLCAWLGSSGLAGRPDLVYGVARVPDHVPGSLGIGRARLVEWEVVHAARAALPPAAPAVVATFDARDAWAARRVGEPSVLDEDLGLEYLRFADLGPERTLGIARRVEVDATGGGHSGEAGSHDPWVVVGVTGLLVLHPAGVADGALARMTAARPLQVAPDPGTHVAVLDWAAVARVVAPRGDRRPLLPSPFPYLPSTPAELLESYLAIVGVRPQDCYSAQVTQDRPTDVIGGTPHVRTTSAEAEPAADGTVRRRFRGGSRVVVAYRDDPAYAAGRERWAAYERDVLQADLSVGTAVRAPVERPSRLETGALGRVVRGVEAVGGFLDGDSDRRTRFDDIPPARYCWPPVG